MFEQAAKPRDVASVSAVDNEHNLFGYPGLCADAARESRDATPFSPERYYDGDAHKKQIDLQMVVKNVTPSWVVRRMVAQP